MARSGISAGADMTDRATAYDPDVPLRLKVAAEVAFPDGSMTVSGLRREAHRGRLVIERIAGKDYTTLAAIEQMRMQCRLQQRGRVSGSEKLDETGEVGLPTHPSTSSETGTINRAQAAARMIVAELKGRSKPTSTPSTPRRRNKASVIPLKSRLPTS
jgi:hypothetical protein